MVREEWKKAGGRRGTEKKCDKGLRAKSHTHTLRHINALHGGDTAIVINASSSKI